jgi:hypothetical protein
VPRPVTAAACRTALHPAACHVTTGTGQVCCILNVGLGLVCYNTNRQAHRLLTVM